MLRSDVVSGYEWPTHAENRPGFYVWFTRAGEPFSPVVQDVVDLLGLARLYALEGVSRDVAENDEMDRYLSHNPTRWAWLARFRDPRSAVRHPANFGGQ